MINLVTVISTEIKTKSAALKQLFIKVRRYGKGDVQTPIQVSAYGIDSNPIEGMVAVYAKCGSDNNNVIIGYINKNSIAKVGELRLFSTDANGAEKFYYYLKDDGTTEIGGDTNFAVKFNEMKQENDKLKSTVDALVQKWNAFCASYAPGSSASVGTPPTLATSTVPANTSNWAVAKNDKIKTIG